MSQDWSYWIWLIANNKFNIYSLYNWLLLFFILKVTFSASVWSFLNGSQGSNLESGNLPYINDMQKGGEGNKLNTLLGSCLFELNSCLSVWGVQWNSVQKRDKFIRFMHYLIDTSTLLSLYPWNSAQLEKYKWEKTLT